MLCGEREKQFRGWQGAGVERACGHGHPSAHLLQPGHNAAVMEEVVAGQLPHTLTQLVVIFAYRALQPRACRERGSHDTSNQRCPIGETAHPEPPWTQGRERGYVLSLVSQENRGDTDKASPLSQPLV